MVTNQTQWDLSKKFKPRKTDWWDTTTFRDVRVRDRVILLQVPGAKGNKSERGLFGTGIVVSVGKPRYTRVGSSKSRITIKYLRRLRPFIPLTQDTIGQARADLSRVAHGTLRALLMAEPAQTQTFVSISKGDLNTLNRAVAAITRQHTTSAGAKGSQHDSSGLEQALAMLKGPLRTEVTREVTARVGQEIVRKNAIANYPRGCALCKVPITESELLTASHIKPWSMSNKKERFDHANVILLCALHDRLFDKGFVEIERDYRVRMARDLRGEAGALIKGLTVSRLRGWARVSPRQQYLAFRLRLTR